MNKFDSTPNQARVFFSGIQHTKPGWTKKNCIFRTVQFHEKKWRQMDDEDRQNDESEKDKDDADKMMTVMPTTMKFDGENDDYEDCDYTSFFQSPRAPWIGSKPLSQSPHCSLQSKAYISICLLLFINWSTHNTTVIYNATVLYAYLVLAQLDPPNPQPSTCVKLNGRGNLRLFWPPGNSSSDMPTQKQSFFLKWKT